MTHRRIGRTITLVLTIPLPLIVVMAPALRRRDVGGRYVYPVGQLKGGWL
jgi:hypothetical protein